MKRRLCQLRNVGFKNKNGFVSGERFCGSSDAIEISIESLGCSNKNQMLTFLTIGRKKTADTWSECRDFCDEKDECEYFQWQVISRTIR